jgi:hypothetical protein
MNGFQENKRQQSVLGHRQVTFDRAIMIEAVGGAESQNLVVLT